MRPNTLLRYLHHARAVEAQEALEQASVLAVPHLTGQAQADAIERWRLIADGLSPADVAAALQARKEERWTANWNTLRGRLGATRARRPGRGGPPVPLRPGERIVAPRA